MNDALENLDFNPVPPDDISVGDSNTITSYWRASCGENFAPVWTRDFSLEHLPVKIIPNLAVVDVLNGGENYLYRFWGTHQVNAKGYDMTGRLLTETPTQKSVGIGRLHFDWIVENKKPMAIMFNPHFLKHGFPTLISFRYPLSSDGKTVDKIVTYQPLDVEPSKWVEAFDILRRNEAPPDDRQD